MVNVQFGSSTKDIWVLEDVYPDDDALEMVKEQKDKLFGLMSGLRKTFSKQESTIQISDKRKRYEPFWYIEGKSTFEYLRMTDHAFPVGPEVIEVTVGKKKFKTKEGEAELHFEGEDHCFEEFIQAITESAVDGVSKGLDVYLNAEKKKKIKSPNVLLKKGEIVPIKNRASFIVSRIVKDLLKPIQADKVLKEKVTITQLDLYFRPVYSYELIDTKNNKKKYVELDGITGEITKVNTWTQGIKDKMKDASLFDVGTEIGGELASNIIPGAGVAAIGTKYILGKRKEKKKKTEAAKTQKAYAKSKKTKKKKK